MTVTPPEGNAAETSVQEKIEAKTDQQQIDTNVNQVAQEEKPVEKAEDPNWKAFREARKKDRADKEAAERRAAEKEAEAAALKAAMEAAFAKSSPPLQQQYGYANQYEQPEETEEQRIERKVTEALAKHEAKRRQELEEMERAQYPARLNQTYPDFNNIVTTENMDYLEYHHPELARPLKRLADGYDKWSDVYQAIKKYVPNAPNAKKDSARAAANLMKPKSMSSVGLTQNMDGNSGARLSDEKKAANWARMQQSLRSVQ